MALGRGLSGAKIKIRFTREQADAIRETSQLSGGHGSEIDDAIYRDAGLDPRLIFFPSRCTIRVGERPRVDPRGMDPRDRRNSFAARARYVERPPACRECGEPIEHGERAVVFGYKPTTWNYGWGDPMFLHETCDELDDRADFDPPPVGEL